MGIPMVIMSLDINRFYWFGLYMPMRYNIFVKFYWEDELKGDLVESSTSSL